MAFSVKNRILSALAILAVSAAMTSCGAVIEACSGPYYVPYYVPRGSGIRVVPYTVPYVVPCAPPPPRYQVPRSSRGGRYIPNPPERSRKGNHRTK